MELVGSAEIAERLGLTQSRVNQLASGDTFPEPVAELTAGRIWKWEDVETWRAEHRPERPAGAARRSTSHDDALTCTLEEAADLIGVSRSTVSRLLEQGLIYERKVPGVRRRLISRASVVAFVEGGHNG